MRICYVTFSLEDFGGLEEFAKNLAIGVKQKGHEVCFLSTAWVPSENQYLKSIRNHNIAFFQPPKWISWPSSDWRTKERILAVIMKIFIPIILILTLGVFIFKSHNWSKAHNSAYHWLEGRLGQFIRPDWRKPLTRLMLAWWKLRWRPDLLHLHGYTSNLLFVIDWAYAHHMPVVYEEHQTPDAQFDWWKDFKRSINKADVIVAVSEKSAQTLQSVAGVTQPIEIIYYLVPDPLAAGWNDDDRSLRNDMPVQATTLARLYVTKGLAYLLDAIAKVRVIHPTAKFKVYGDGPLRKELLVYAHKLGLDGNEIFIGPFTKREDLDKIMAQTDIFVLSSILEGLPVALIEAMSYGRPILATPVGGIPEAIHDGENGLLCDPGDTECLARKLMILIEQPELRKQFGEAARRSYEEGPFHPSFVSDRYIGTYEKVLSRRKSS